MKTVKICDHGECGGECYRCRLDCMEADLRKLFDAVAEMRHAQKEFFRLHSRPAFKNAKRAEQVVDRILEEMTSRKLF
ncbi:MAG: hypothetical protein D6741_19675 [Planctomycetota bacterium]|nr:MAG: hypothetical protein D6741_19675 [Planctomycetota bacterium]